MNTPFLRLNTRPQLLAALVICCLLPLGAYAQGQAARRKQSPAPLQSLLEAKADAIIKRAMSEKCIPGLMLAIVKDGQVVVKKGYGVKSLEAPTPELPDENTLFYIGSLSKAVTAFGIMRLVDKNWLKVTDKASKYIPILPAKWRDIELRYFLAHQSGIPQLKQHVPNFELMLHSVAHVDLTFQPGTRYEYNNFNFAVAGKVIESASRRSYLDFMQSEIFFPLGMLHTGFDQPGANHATGYRRKGLHENEDDEQGAQQPDQSQSDCQQITINKVEPSGRYSIPSGFLQTTVADLLKLYWAIERQQLLTPASYEAMFSRVTPQFSGTLGWFQTNPGGIQIIEKNGSGTRQGFSSEFMFAPAPRAAVIILMNQPATQAAAIAKELLREVCGLPLPIKAAPQSKAER